MRWLVLILMTLGCVAENSESGKKIPVKLSDGTSLECKAINPGTTRVLLQNCSTAFSNFPLVGNIL
jgi:hypothetical protein